MGKHNENWCRSSGRPHTWLVSAPASIRSLLFFLVICTGLQNTPSRFSLFCDCPVSHATSKQRNAQIESGVLASQPGNFWSGGIQLGLNDLARCVANTQILRRRLLLLPTLMSPKKRQHLMNRLMLSCVAIQNKYVAEQSKPAHKAIFQLA